MTDFELMNKLIDYGKDNSISLFLEIAEEILRGEQKSDFMDKAIVFWNGKESSDDVKKLRYRKKITEGAKNGKQD